MSIFASHYPSIIQAVDATWFRANIEPLLISGTPPRSTAGSGVPQIAAYAYGCEIMRFQHPFLDQLNDAIGFLLSRNMPPCYHRANLQAASAQNFLGHALEFIAVKRILERLAQAGWQAEYNWPQTSSKADVLISQPYQVNMDIKARIAYRPGAEIAEYLRDWQTLSDYFGLGCRFSADWLPCFEAEQPLTRSAVLEQLDTQIAASLRAERCQSRWPSQHSNNAGNPLVVIRVDGGSRPGWNRDESLKSDIGKLQLPATQLSSSNANIGVLLGYSLQCTVFEDNSYWRALGYGESSMLGVFQGSDGAEIGGILYLSYDSNGDCTRNALIVNTASNIPIPDPTCLADILGAQLIQ